MKKLNLIAVDIGVSNGRVFLLAIDLVKDRDSNEPFVEAGKMVYEEVFKRGLAWIPAGNILRLAPPLIMTEELSSIALDIIDEAISVTEKHFGY